MDLADRLDHARAQQQAVGHRLAADVEVAVLEPQDLVDRGVRLVDVEGRRLRLGQDPDLGRADLDVAGRQARVLGPGEPALDVADDRDDELGADPAGLLVRGRRVGLVDDDLGQAVAVAQVEEDELAVVAAAMDPAGQTRRSARRRRPAARRRCGCGRAWRGWAWGRSWPAYRSRSGVPSRTRGGAPVLTDRRAHTILPSSMSRGFGRSTRTCSGSPPRPSARRGAVRRRRGDGVRGLPHGVPSTGAHTQMAFTVLDVEAEVAELQGRGVVFESTSRRRPTTASRPCRPGRAAWFKDPHGNLLAVIQFDEPT